MPKPDQPRQWVLTNQRQSGTCHNFTIEGKQILLSFCKIMNHMCSSFMLGVCIFRAMGWFFLQDDGLFDKLDILGLLGLVAWLGLYFVQHQHISLALLKCNFVQKNLLGYLTQGLLRSLFPDNFIFGLWKDTCKNNEHVSMLTFTLAQSTAVSYIQWAFVFLRFCLEAWMNQSFLIKVIAFLPIGNWKDFGFGSYLVVAETFGLHFAFFPFSEWFQWETESSRRRQRGELFWFDHLVDGFSYFSPAGEYESLLINWLIRLRLYPGNRSWETKTQRVHIYHTSKWSLQCWLEMVIIVISVENEVSYFKNWLLSEILRPFLYFFWCQTHNIKVNRDKSYVQSVSSCES